MRRVIIAVLIATVAVGVTVPKDGVAQSEPAPKAIVKGHTITGQCHCGTVKYEAQDPVVKSSTCDCRACQRATGTLQVPFITVQRSSFRITAGETTEFRGTSEAKCDRHGTWHFCPKCGTQLFWKGNKGKELDVFVGTLDDPSLFQPKK